MSCCAVLCCATAVGPGAARRGASGGGRLHCEGYPRRSEPGAVAWGGGALGRGEAQWVPAAAAAVGPGTVRGAWGWGGGMGLGRGWYIYICTLVFVLAVQCILIFVYIHNIYIRVHV